jgi:hypothetical protein
MGGDSLGRFWDCGASMHAPELPRQTARKSKARSASQCLREGRRPRQAPHPHRSGAERQGVEALCGGRGSMLRLHGRLH